MIAHHTAEALALADLERDPAAPSYAPRYLDASEGYPVSAAMAQVRVATALARRSP